jgi:hypothetical protein
VSTMRVTRRLSTIRVTRRVSTIRVIRRLSTIRVTERVYYKKQQLFTLCSPSFLYGVFVDHLFSFLCCGFCFLLGEVDF